MKTKIPSLLFLTLIFLCTVVTYATPIVPLDLYPSQQDILTSSWFLLPQAKAILLVVIFIGIFTEIKTAGTGIAGGIAIVAAVMLFGINFLGGQGSWMEVALFILGLGLLFIEVFIPGFGVFGVGGILCLLASFYYILGANGAALSYLAGSLVIAIGIFAILVKHLPHNPAWNKFVLQDKQENKDGYSSSADWGRCLGQKGVTLTPLRPSGAVQLAGQRVDVVTEGEFVAAGQTVVVIRVEGNKIIVAKEGVIC